MLLVISDFSCHTCGRCIVLSCNGICGRADSRNSRSTLILTVSVRAYSTSCHSDSSIGGTNDFLQVSVQILGHRSLGPQAVKSGSLKSAGLGDGLHRRGHSVRMCQPHSPSPELPFEPATRWLAWPAQCTFRGHSSLRILCSNLLYPVRFCDLALVRIEHEISRSELSRDDTWKCSFASGSLRRCPNSRHIHLASSGVRYIEIRLTDCSLSRSISLTVDSPSQPMALRRCLVRFRRAVFGCSTRYP